MFLPGLPVLSVPEAEIIRQSEGSTSAALQLAAAWGYGLACRDLDLVCGAAPVRVPAPGQEGQP